MLPKYERVILLTRGIDVDYDRISQHRLEKCTVSVSATRLKKNPVVKGGQIGDAIVIVSDINSWHNLKVFQ